jgi:hypothetical protein
VREQSGFIRCCMRVAAIGLMLWASAIAVESGAPTDSLRKHLEAHRVNPQSPKVDGRLDDEVWRGAEFVSDFLQKEPEEGKPPSERTEVAVVYDDDQLYIGARCYSAAPEELTMYLDRRDRQGPSEQFIVSIDSYCDRRTAYGFGVSSAGVRFDRYNPDDDEYWRDYTWDPVWKARTAVDSLSWTVEMSIPFSQLRFTDKEEQVWGVNFNRWVPARNEDIYWVIVPRQETGWASRFGNLTGVKGIKPSSRLEVVPYVASHLVQEKGKNPWVDPVDKEITAGGDLKMGLGPNMTLDATVNPDFGQVEADPAVVNLSAFETIFDERRPFFLEGSQLLQGTGPAYYYSRRIGAQSRILGAGKVTGHMQDGTSTGLLLAVSERDLALDVPLSGYGVGRLQRQFGANQSSAGISLAAVARDLSPQASLRESYREHAESGGADWTLRFDRGQLELRGYAGASYIAGSREAIQAAQTSSARYYQRPDATYLHYDSTRTSLFGYTTSLAVQRKGGRHWLWEAGAAAESPGFELNDVGRLSTSDDLDAYGSLAYRETTPRGTFRSYSFDVSSSANWNYDGARQYSSLAFNANTTWRNYYQTWLWYEFGPPGQDDAKTRGGPTMAREVNNSVGGGINNGFTRTFQWETWANYGVDDLDGWLYAVGGSVAGRLGPHLKCSLSPRYQREDQPRQYVSTVSGSGGGDFTYGSRYVFSRISQSTLSAELRLNYYLTPDLSLELYAQPFAASGHYYRHGELKAAGGNDLRIYEDDSTVTVTPEADGSLSIQDGGQTFSLPYLDFNVLSLRSNVVLRWEFRPGSTLYLVWQQNLEDDLPLDQAVGPGSLWDSFKVGGQNFFAFKIAYWIPVT